MRSFSRACAVGVLFLCGCVATEGDRKLNEQNFFAGSFIAENAQDPKVKQAGADVAANAQVVAVGIGKPKASTKTYSSEASAAARKQAKEEHEAESGIFTWIKKNVASHIPWGGVAIGLLGGIVGLGRKLIQNKRKLIAVYDGVSKGVSQLKAIKAGEDVDLGKILVDTLRTAATAHNVYVPIKKEIGNLVKKGVINAS